MKRRRTWRAEKTKKMKTEIDEKEKRVRSKRDEKAKKMRSKRDEKRSVKEMKMRRIWRVNAKDERESTNSRWEELKTLWTSESKTKSVSKGT